MSDNKEFEEKDSRITGENDGYVKPPSLFQMLKTFTKEVSTYIANGAPNVSIEDYVSRLETCESCEYFIVKSARCGKCVCLMQHKAKMKTSDCPIGKWEKQTLTTEQKETFEKHEKLREKARAETSEKNLKPSTTRHVEYTPEEFKKLKEENAKRQKDNNTDSSN